MVKILKQIQKMMFVEERSKQEVWNYIDGEFDKIYRGEYDMSWFIITQKFSRPVEEYATPMPHITLVKTLQERDPASAPKVGARIPYVFVPSHRKAKTAERVEDPKYALKHKLAIDYEFYIKEQFREPINNALKLWMDPRQINRLFTRNRDVKLNKRVAKELFTMFDDMRGAEVVLHNKCIVCQARPVVRQGAIEYAVCNSRHCIERVDALLEGAKTEQQQLQAKAEETWDICRACVKKNTPGLDIGQCSNSTCEYWFMRTEKQHRADEAKQVVNRISACQTFADRLQAVAIDW
jgi:DNA polymerase delta subunit 1